MQEVAEANFLPLEQSCKTGRGFVPYIRVQQMYLFNKQALSGRYDFDILKPRLLLNSSNNNNNNQNKVYLYGT